MQRRLLILLLILGVGAGVALAAWALTERYERKQALAGAFDRLRLFHDLRQAALEDYLRSTASDVRAASENPRVVEAMERLDVAWGRYGADARKVLPRLYAKGKTAPSGPKAERAEAGDNSAYGPYHRTFHDWAQRFLEHFGYYDAFLINPRGDIVYSVAKESDFATSLETGPYRDSPLAEVYRRVMANPAAGVDFSDFARYAPSGNDPAAFAGHAILKDAEVIGIFAVQIPAEPLNELMHFTAGMGGSGETYLVGEDRLMRSQSRFIAMPTLLETKVDNASVRQGIAGKSGARVVRDYRGIPVLSVYAPVDFGGQNWVLLSEIDEAEVYETRSRWLAIAIGGIAGLIVIGLALVWRLRRQRVTRSRAA